jgi:hypothetical protein
MKVLAPPLRFEPSFETPEEDEETTRAELTEAMRGIQEKTFANGGRPLRAVHAKSHGVLLGTLHVRAGLPSELAQGLFAHAASYDVVMRVSTNPGDLLDDAVSVPRGLAIKVIGVQGERLPGSEGDVTQDFLFVNGPAFLKKDGKSFVGSVKLLAATTDKAPQTKQAVSALMRGVERAIEAVGGHSATVIGLGGQPLTHPLIDTYFSQTPLLYGEYMAKLSLAPASASLAALGRAPLDAKDDADVLRHAIGTFFATQSAGWELRVQLCTDLDTMPIENSKTVWPEDSSPYVTVAQLVVPAQTTDDVARAAALDAGLSFSPWHGLSVHRPLGSINRLRRSVYDDARRFRAEHRGCPLAEPRSVADLL